MNKKDLKIENLKKQQSATAKVLENLKARKLKNTLSEEAVAEAEALIAEKEAELENLKQMLEELNAAEEDKSAELLAKIAELQNKIEGIENSLKQPQGILKLQNYLNSKKANKDFLQVVKNSKSAADFKNNWNAKLIENGITPADVMLPPAIVAEINDAWEKDANNFLTLLDVTGLKSYKLLLEEGDLDAETSRAGGHKKGTSKTEQVLDFEPKEIRPQIIYKYITIDRETELEDENGVLVQYITRELATRIMHEIMRAILIGDGRESSSNRKISKFEAIKRTTTDAYVTVVNAAAATPTIEEVASAVDAIEADGDIILFVSKQTLRALQTYVAATGGTTQYKSSEALADELGVSEIRTTKLLSDTERAAAIAFVGKAYKVVGNLTLAGFDNFNLQYNSKEYLTEIYAGGGLGMFKSAAVVLRPQS